MARSRPEMAFGAVAAIAVTAMLLTPRDAAPASRGLPDLRQPRLRVTLFILGSGLIEGISVGFGASALADVGLSSATAARLTSWFFVAYLLSRLSLYWLTGRVGADRLFLVGLGGAGAAMALAALGAPSLGYVSAGAFVGLIFPSYYIWASGILGRDSRMTAAILTMALLGGTLAPIAIRPTLAETGEDGVFWMVAKVGLSLAGIFAGLGPRPRGPAPS